MGYDPKIGSIKGIKNFLAGTISVGIAFLLNAGNFVVGNCPEVAGYVLIESVTIKTVWDLIANYLKHK